MNRPPLASELNLCLCHSCGLACDITDNPHECKRCGAPLHARKADSLTRTWAYLLAALVFYIPANLLPVMNTSLFGSGSDSTIMSGVLEFWEHGAWDIALIIFHRQHRGTGHQVRCPFPAADHGATRQPLGAQGAFEALPFRRADRLLVDARCDCGRAGRRTG